MVKFKGVPLEFGDRTVIVPGLSLSQLRRHSEVVTQCIEVEKMAPGPEQLYAMLEPVSMLVHLALSRNYEDITLEHVQDAVDTGTVQEFVSAIMGQSGMRRVRAVEGEASGEA